MHTEASSRRRLARRSHLLALAGLALATAAACRPAAPTPEETLRTFLGDLRGGRPDSAWAALSEATKKTLEERHAALAAASGRPAEPRPAKLLYDELGVMTLSVPESIAVVSPPGHEVTLRVTVKDGRSSDVRLVREGSGWKIDLLGSLRPIPPPGPAPVEETDTATDTATTAD
ncbi:hypothetical protein L6R52_37280 [Myxococcota bacterium]|nr:hypothetical protein [Myxococcota bacterium]